tara:strand:+ start:34 stop:573 length:540 start_codon:yes stop_codon:yes gene_type:complete
MKRNFKPILLGGFHYMYFLKETILLITLFSSIALSQGEIQIERIPSNTGARYVSGQDGVIRMYVNVWGHVDLPGRILVDEGIDLATLFSLTGGPKKGANLKEIRVYHEYPDKYGNVVSIINLTPFINTGDRSNFISIQPNDTFIIKQTSFSYLLEQIGTINTLMGLINIYLNLSNLSLD